MAEQYLNQPAAEWARRNLAREVEIKLRGNSWPARVVVALAMLFLGVIFEKLKVEMVFTDGTATLAPLMENRREVLDLLETLPARRKSDGRL